MENILYYDCFCGISGDMNLGAMIDIGVDPDYLKKELQKLRLPGFKLEIKKETKNGISGTHADVVLTHDHHGHEQHDHHDHNHHGPHRGLTEITEIINASGLAEPVKTMSKKMFKRLAEAEAKIHDTTPEKIHFHEVGAVDSIVDIVGSAVCIDYLKPDKIISSPVQVGGGFIDIAHGHFPVPAPATADLLTNIPMKTGLVDSETTTPTGALIVSTFAGEFTSNIDFAVEKIGYGLGTKTFERVPNVLRVYWGQASEATPKENDNRQKEYETETQTVIECNIDDMNPELYEPLFAELFKAGAKDVYMTPIIMKKTRPAVTLHVLCENKDVDKTIDTIFLHSSTFGVRSYQVRKTMLKRTFHTVDTPYGKIRIKYGFAGKTPMKVKPEYADCVEAAERHGVSVKEVYDNIVTKSNQETEPETQTDNGNRRRE